MPNTAVPLRAVALFELAKGLLVMAAGLGALSLLHRDTRQLAEQLIGRMHLNPASHLPQVFLSYAARLTDARLGLLAALAALYVAVRWTEAYGLWHGRRWAEWFAAASGAIYIPVEVWELFHGNAWLAAAELVANLLIVGLMVRVLWRHTGAGRAV